MVLTKSIGDLVLVPGGSVIAHQVNPYSMGAGLAANLMDKWPSVFTNHKKKKEGEGWKLGDIQLVLVDATSNIYVASCCGQETVGAGQVNTDCDAVLTYLIMLAKLSEALNLTIYLPEMLGSGLGGGSRSTILMIMEAVFGDRTLESRGVIVRYEANIEPYSNKW